jgi:peptidoglycan/LPS O-acetylase OafA/YrhL
MSEIRPLTTLRFFAAALVFVEHARLIPGCEWVNADTVPGMAGVAVFFVLSGFILSYTYEDRDWRGSFGANAGEFYWSRFARIYPLHWLMFLVALPIALQSRTSHVSVSDFPWLLTLTDKLWPGAHFGPPPVFVAWTLSCEALFYLATPLILLGLSKRRNPLMAASMLFVAYTALVLAADYRYHKLNWQAYLQAPQFLLGVAGYQLYRRVNCSRYSVWLAVIGTASLLVPHMFSAQETRFTRLGYAPGALLIVLGLASDAGAMKALLSRPFLVLLGQSSYALYLLHDPVLRYSRVGFEKLGITVPLILTVPVMLIAFGVTVSGSVICFTFYENPTRLWLRAAFGRKKPKPQQTAASTLTSATLPIEPSKPGE